MITRQAVIDATKRSAQKWRAIQAGKGFDAGRTNCALCQLFFAHDCKGCPVNAKTHDSCDGTPYTAWSDLTWSDDDIILLEYPTGKFKGYAVLSDKAAAVAVSMARYLEDLAKELEAND